jgi:lipopolysaccharide transport system permease protein/teichoic acid transport system permease protein
MITSTPTLSVVQFFRQTLQHRDMIFALAVRELQSKYIGTLGGVFWAFVHPLAIVTVFYFVFAVGFRAQGPSSTPFILWFVCGLIPWFYFNDTLQAITNSITGNAHLVKKTIFPTEVLPLVQVIASLFPHLIFMLMLVGMLFFFNVPFLPERLLIIYYLFCTVTLVLGLGWLLSALQVFYRDIAQALTIILNLWFWVTPIVWAQGIIPPEYRSLLSFNPVFYIVEGYRGLLIYNSTLWPTIQETAYFWCINLMVLFLGIYVFRRLKPEFADVI